MYQMWSKLQNCLCIFFFSQLCNIKKSKKGCNDQESIQSSTTPDPGYQWESDKLTADTTNESQEVSPFPAGDHKAHINRRAQRHSKHKTEQKHKRSKYNIEGPVYFFSVRKSLFRTVQSHLGASLIQWDIETFAYHLRPPLDRNISLKGSTTKGAAHRLVCGFVILLS